MLTMMNVWKFRLLALAMLSVWMLSALAQTPEDDDAPVDTTQATASVPLFIQTGKTLRGKDSIDHVLLPVLSKFPPMTFESQKAQDRYNRLVYNVKKVLPIAKLVKQTMLETYEVLEMLPPAERKAHIERVEKNLRKQYSPLLKGLTVSQGKLLVKLVDRECGQSSYEIAKAFIGPFQAGLYQALAWTFGQSLKKRYDPKGDDRYTERVVLMVESGQL